MNIIKLNEIETTKNESNIESKAQQEFISTINIENNNNDDSKEEMAIDCVGISKIEEDKANIEEENVWIEMNPKENEKNELDNMEEEPLQYIINGNNEEASSTTTDEASTISSDEPVV